MSLRGYLESPMLQVFSAMEAQDQKVEGRDHNGNNQKNNRDNDLNSAFLLKDKLKDHF